MAAKEDGRTDRRPRDAAGWLALAASPTFALMAAVTAGDASPTALCAAGSPLLPGMTAMYLLMSLFHLPPWLKSRPWARTHPILEGDRR